MSSTLSSKTVLLLGAGFVTRPCAELLSKDGVKVTVACRTLGSAEKLAAGLDNVTPISLDVDNADELDGQVAKVDLVISLIPYVHHVKVIKSAIRQKKNVVTTSYISPAMQELDEEAKQAGITVFNEIGLDPGIDHLYAVKTIKDVHDEGGKIKTFRSFCGGLPAPESSDNPLGYKFSWSPRGVLLALSRYAQYIEDGQEKELTPENLMEAAKPYPGYPGYSFVAYPNGNSVPYRERYGIPEADTIIRGTLRYSVFPKMASTFRDLGFLSEEKVDYLDSTKEPVSWAEALANVTGATSSKEADLIWAVSSKTQFASTEEKERIVAGLRWFGMLSEKVKVTPRDTPLDTLCATLEQKMALEDGDRDMIFLQHTFGIEKADGSKITRTSTLVQYGAPTGSDKPSAMAELVGVPCALAVEKVLDGTITKKGVFAPMDWEVASVMIEALEKRGIKLTEVDYDL